MKTLFSQAEKIVIRSCDSQDAEQWALLSDHVSMMAVGWQFDQIVKTFMFDDGSKLVIVGVNYSSIPDSEQVH